MQWFRSYRRVAICVALTSDLMLSSFGGIAHVKQEWLDSAPKSAIVPFANTATAEDITREEGCELIDTAWSHGNFYLAHHTNSNSLEPPADLQPEGILELPFKPLFCPIPAPDVATVTL